ncbi:hypothetical protein [Acetobacter thailandicus]|uniref:Uncharacterized protein n=1 Tax=Acetobacter thailandicus TaxID=1502842 RepID=A0ABT3QDN9_9PROT|nr:hypothetical protein [Acetobacter thailandicus]MCX2563385.1 hypothetical protein [Acetobacter thailandicus]NHN94138.1 hypothetical protein [Acetobacter thailandicus]
MEVVPRKILHCIAYFFRKHLDLPALELPLETSGKGPIPQLRERIAMARTHQEWFRIMRKLDRSRAQYAVKTDPNILQIENGKKVKIFRKNI